MTMPMRPRVDGYGRPIKEPAWQGYTLDDLIRYAQTGVPTSSVPRGEVGYGLDEVGNANVVHEAGNPRTGPNWKQVLAGALAGLANTAPGAGVANLGRGFVGGTAYFNDQSAQRRRDALTDSQTQYQQQLAERLADQLAFAPEEQDAQRAAWAADRAAETEDLALTKQRRENLSQGLLMDQERLPYLIAADKALAAQRNRSNQGEPDPRTMDEAAFIRSVVPRLLTMVRRDDAGYPTSSRTVEEATAEARAIWRAAQPQGAAGPGYKPSGFVLSSQFGASGDPQAIFGGGNAPGPRAGPKEPVTTEEYAMLRQQYGDAFAREHYVVEGR